MTPKDKTTGCEEINRHNHSYYVLNARRYPTRISTCCSRSLRLWRKSILNLPIRDSPTQRVGSDLTKGFEHVVHARPMMSLSNTYSIGEVDDWFNRMDKALEGEDSSIVGEMKLTALPYRSPIATEDL